MKSIINGNLARQETISYTGDRFGRTTESVLSIRKTTIADFKRIADSKMRDESNFRHGMDLVGELDFIVTDSDADAQKIIASFKSMGFSLARWAQD